MKRIPMLMLSLAIPALLAAQSSGGGCTNNDFSGLYVALGEGNATFQPPDNPPPLPPRDNVVGPLVRVGRVLAQNGNLEFTYTVGVYHGKVFHEPFKGTYTVHPDCTLDLLFPQGPTPLDPLPLPFTGALADKGNSARVSSVTPLTVATATLTRMTGVGCSTSAVRGTYLLDMSGFVVNWQVPWDSNLPPRNPVPGANCTDQMSSQGCRYGTFARVGRLLLDGNGNFTGTTMANYQGLLEFETLTNGTYSVDSECKLNLTAQVTEAAPTADQLPLPYQNLLPPVAGPSYTLTLVGVMTDYTNGSLIQEAPEGVAVNGRLVLTSPVVKSHAVGFAPGQP